MKKDPPAEAAEALHSLRSEQQGLSTAEAQRRLLEFGPNRIERLQGPPLVLRFVQSFTHFFALILWLAAGLAFLAEHYGPQSGMATLGWAIVGVILLNGVFSFWQEYRAEQALAALRKLLPHQVKVLRDGAVQELPACELVPGDVILLDGGDDIPADCRVLQAFAARVNNATVTGESVPQARDEQADSEEELIHRRNILLAGTSLVSGQAQALVFATGMRSEFGRIAHLAQDTRELHSPLQQEIVRLSRLIAALATALGVVFFLIGQALGLPFWGNFIFAIGVIVANVPEGLLPTVTLSLALASQRMARRHALIRHLPAVETLGSATVICTDKTGTLTANRMAVKRIFLGGRLYAAADWSELRQRQSDCPQFFETAGLCQTLKEVLTGRHERLLGDPMEIALVEMTRAFFPSLPAYPKVDEIPFDSERCRLSTVHRGPAGLVLYCKGALETMLPRCRCVQVGTEIQPLTSEWKARFQKTENELGQEGFRVLALAYRPIQEPYERARLEEDLVLSGLVGLEDPVRPEVPAAIRTCREAGIKVIMVTGDHPQTALAVARQVGLITTNEATVISGPQLRRLSATQLQLALDAKEILFARVGADQKMRIVQALKAKKQVVAVTGDGVNDAPALRQADIGIAMGIAGTDVAREAADMVLLDDNFASIVAAIEEGRAVYANIRKFLTYILSSNVPELVPYLGFVLFRVPLALTVIQILAVDLGTDMLPALGLGAEQPDRQTMQLPPRSRRERLLNWPLLARSYLFLGAIEAGAALAAFFFVLRNAGWGHGDPLAADSPLYRQGTTACLSAIVVMQVVNVFLCRSDRQSVFSSGPFSNPLIMGGIVTELLLIAWIDYTDLGNMVLGTAPIPGNVWLFMIPFALTLLLLEEGRKWLVRHREALHQVAPCRREPGFRLSGRDVKYRTGSS